jgi:ubiquinone/menaquinone biosynthesis C-methylase UbiE
MQHLPDQHFITRLYRWFCNLIYYEFSWAYNLTSVIVSAGQWNKWRSLGLKYIKPGNVLELGCGTGYLLKKSKSEHINIFGLDLSLQMLSCSKILLKKNNLTCPLIRADGTQLPFQNNSVDNIIATFPEQYITESKTISECARILKKNQPAKGKMIIVGRWIVMNNMLLKHLFPVFYRMPTEDQKNEITNLFKIHNFNVNFHEHTLGLVSVYVIEAEIKP